MYVEVFRVDNPRSIFTPEQAPKVDFSTNEDHDSQGKVMIVPEFGSLPALSTITAVIIAMVVMKSRMAKYGE